MRRARSTTRSQASATAGPQTTAERDAKLPIPRWTRRVSPNATSMRSRPIPVRSATTWAKEVSWPWPWLCVPMNSVAAPDGWTWRRALSQLPTVAPIAGARSDAQPPQLAA